MRLYAKPNLTDKSLYELYYKYGNEKLILALVSWDDLDNDLKEALSENEDQAFDLELELK